MLPLILLMFLLSRWSGGLVGRYGPRLPLMRCPVIVAAGISAVRDCLPAGGELLDYIFPGHDCARIRHGRQRRTADHGGDGLD